jgi:hypothetical protein
LVRLLTLYLAAGVEVGAAAIVGFAACEAIVRAVRDLFEAPDLGEFHRRNPLEARSLAGACNRIRASGRHYSHNDRADVE